jgi:cytochrome c oxidase assembly factor CtaG
MVWSLPRGVRLAVGRWLCRGAPVRRALELGTWRPAAWLLYTLTLWGWHVPAAYELAIGEGPIHDLEHLAFFATGVLFWWSVVNPAPRLYPSGRYLARIVYVVLAHLQNALLGLALMMAPRVLYPTYAATGLGETSSPLDDQFWGGLIMWAGGGGIHMLAVLILMARLFSEPASRHSLGVAEGVPDRCATPGVVRPAPRLG